MFSDVNVHKTKSFLRPKFQFVSISKRNVFFYTLVACLKHAFFVYFMSERIQLFDLELKFSVRFDIETRADHRNFVFRFDLETKRCVLFKLLCARNKNHTTTFDILFF
jgi:hypothetical protein